MQATVTVTADKFKYNIQDLEYEDCKLLKRALCQAWWWTEKEEDKRVAVLMKKLEMLGVE